MAEKLTLEQACLYYRVAEAMVAAITTRWPPPSLESEFAADMLHEAMQDLFFAGGTGEDIEREQRAAGTWEEATP